MYKGAVLAESGFADRARTAAGVFGAFASLEIHSVFIRDIGDEFAGRFMENPFIGGGNIGNFLFLFFTAAKKQQGDEAGEESQF